MMGGHMPWAVAFWAGSHFKKKSLVANWYLALNPNLRACSVTCKIEFAVIYHVWQVAKHLGLSSSIQLETKILPLGYCMYSSSSHPLDLPPDIRHCLLIEILKLIQILLIFLLDIIRSGVRKDPIPSHTSVLSGYHWLLELLTGHPERIHCELGIHKEVFLQLVYELRTMGHSDSKSVALEEQVAIFLYTYLCDWPHNPTCWRAVSALEWHYFSVSFQCFTPHDDLIAVLYD